MKTLYTLLILATLSGCSPALSQYGNLNSAFRVGCRTPTIESSLVSNENTLEFKATCTKDK